MYENRHASFSAKPLLRGCVVSVLLVAVITFNAPPTSNSSSDTLWLELQVDFCLCLVHPQLFVDFPCELVPQSVCLPVLLSSTAGGGLLLVSWCLLARVMRSKGASHLSLVGLCLRQFMYLSF